MTFKLNINCDNDAFYGEQKHAERHGGLMGKNVLDINGNTVGTAVFK